MNGQFDAYALLGYARQRWWYVPLACGIAAAAAILGSLLLTPQYSATAKILIDPPASSDPRALINVSPVYLESLKAYEYLASSETLFRKAAGQFNLQPANSHEPLDGLQRRVLKVSKLRDTRILEITVTLPDPAKAAAVAGFLATETARQNQAAGSAGDEDLVEKSQQQLQTAEKALEELRAAWVREENAEAPDTLRYEAEELADVRASVRRDLSRSRADLAERPEEPLASRVRELERQHRELDVRIDALNRRLAAKYARREALQADLAAALRDRDSLRERVRNLRSAIGMQGERLRVIDSGSVPQRPSFPNTPLNVVAAALLALVATLVYLSAGFDLERKRAARVRSASPEPAHERGR